MYLATQTSEKKPAIHDENGKFAKGNQAGKGAGRPKGSTSLNTILRRACNAPVDDGDKSKTKLEAITEKLVAMADGGDLAALKYLLDRYGGTPIQMQRMLERDESVDEVIVA